MQYSSKITEVSKNLSIHDGIEYIDVRFDILRDGEIIEDRRLAFPIGTTADDIRLAVEANCSMYENDHILAEQAQIEVQKDQEISALANELVETSQ